MTEPKKYRSLEEVKRFLQEQSDELKLDTQLVERGLTQLAKIIRAASTRVEAIDFKVLDISGDGKRRKRTVNVDFPTVKVPNVKQLKEHYALAEKLSEQYKYLVNTENEVRLNFGREKGEAFQSVMGSFAKLRSQLEGTLKALFQALNHVAEGHAPKEYKAFVTALAEELEQNRHIECEGIQTMTYAALSKDGQLIFAGYIILQNAVNDQGKMVPHLYITVKWTVGGDVELYVENEFIAPTLLDNGTVIESLKSAAQAIAQQLSLEGFSAQIGNLPVSMQIREPIGGMEPDFFSAQEFIKDIKAQRDELIFVLTTQDPKQVESIQNQIYMELKSLVKKKRSTRIRVRAQANVLTFTFTNMEHGDGIHPHDLDFLSDKYKLSDQKLRKIVNVINGD